MSFVNDEVPNLTSLAVSKFTAKFTAKFTTFRYNFIDQLSFLFLVRLLGKIEIISTFQALQQHRLLQIREKQQL